MNTYSSENFNCPISHVLMENPVIAEDGFTYDKNSIEEWFKTNNTSPMTRSVISKVLIPNIEIKNAIQDFLNSKKINLKTVNINHSCISIEGQNYLHIKLNPNSTQICPVNIICVIDTSGSMSTDASIDNGNESEKDGYTRLDHVKHCMNVIIKSLNEEDNLSIIKFDNIATLLFQLTKTDDAGKIKAHQCINTLYPEGGTNLYSGLQVGLYQLENIRNTNNTNIIIFTDGESTTNPPRGLYSTFAMLLPTLNIKIPFTITTCGFGNNIDSQLLSSISNLCSGNFINISDSSMVGTVFVNYAANIKSTFLINSSLFINDKKINVGTLLNNSTRDFLVLIEDVTNFNIILKINDIIITNINFNVNYNFDNSLSIPTFVRYQIIEKLLWTINNPLIKLEDKEYELNRFYNNLKENYSTSQEVKNYIEDYFQINELDNKGGQIKIAISNLTNYNKWGKTFIRSLIDAYNYQLCINFKDPGIQHFSGELTQSIKEKIELIFISLEPPIPSINYSNKRKLYNTSTTTPLYVDIQPDDTPPSSGRSLSMIDYYNARGGCIGGDSLILMHDNTTKKVSELKKDDIILLYKSGNVIYDTIDCIVKIKTDNIEICNINGLLITPWHPILLDDTKWTFPKDICKPIMTNLDYIYNLVLKNRNNVIINDNVVITLAHGINEPIAYHPYFGSENIINDLKKLGNYDNGLILINTPRYIKYNGYISKIDNDN
jgi:Mg-chelatase subunit ChlD